MERSTFHEERVAVRRYGTLHLDGYSGRSSTRVEIIGETPKRYRVRAITQTRTAGRLVYLEPGQVALVPKRAITVEAAASPFDIEERNPK